METVIISIEKEAGVECIIGQGNFSVFTVDNLATTIKTSVPSVSFGLAMNEAKPKLVRVEGNDEALKAASAKACLEIGAGHVFVIMMRGAFPVNVLNAIKAHPAVCTIYGASENPLEVAVGITELGRCVLGIVDGFAATAIEGEKQKKERKDLLAMIGY
ncbi:MAG: adenosine-specific kinase [Candidatus Methanofastidiosia archaeon]